MKMIPPGGIGKDIILSKAYVEGNGKIHPPAQGWQYDGSGGRTSLTTGVLPLYLARIYRRAAFGCVSLDFLRTCLNLSNHLLGAIVSPRHVLVPVRPPATVPMFPHQGHGSFPAAPQLSQLYIFLVVNSKTSHPVTRFNFFQGWFTLRTGFYRDRAAWVKPAA
jgi:hypothetical protein